MGFCKKSTATTPVCFVEHKNCSDFSFLLHLNNNCFGPYADSVKIWDFRYFFVQFQHIFAHGVAYNFGCLTSDERFECHDSYLDIFLEIQGL